MEITSSAFKNETEIPAKYTCNGENINPPLSFEDVPRQAQSLVLVMDDPDAPSGVFTHWLLWNIDPKITGIAENSVPNSAIQGQNYTGPCPPSGTHHYFFKLSALDSKLDLQPNITEQDLENALQGHILDEAELVGLFSKQ